MALIHSLEKSGNTLFKYRGQIPAILFLTAVPVIYYTDYEVISCGMYTLITTVAIVFCVSWKLSYVGRYSDLHI